MLTAAQMTTLAAAIRADTDSAVVNALAIRNDVLLADLYNAVTATDAWLSSMDGPALIEETDITKFDGLSPGKRDAWRLMLDFSPVDMSKAKNRKAVQDIWGNTDSVPVLQACRRKATKAEVALGGNVVTTNAVSGSKLNWEGTLSYTDIGLALGANL